jgi:hypothetical protein
MSNTEIISLLSIGVAIGAVLITLANFSVARATLALALFDRRMAVYQEVRTASSLALISEKEFMDKDGMMHLHKAMNEGRFLFGPEIGAYIRTLWDAAVEMNKSRQRDDNKKIDAYHAAYTKLVNGTTGLQDLLQPYMAMDHK